MALRTFAPIANAHFYSARALFIRHARATSYIKGAQMTAVLTWCENIFVGCPVTPTFFFGRSHPFLIFSIITKKKKNKQTKKIYTWEVLVISR